MGGGGIVDNKITNNRSRQIAESRWRGTVEGAGRVNNRNKQIGIFMAVDDGWMAFGSYRGNVARDSEMVILPFRCSGTGICIQGRSRSPEAVNYHFRRTTRAWRQLLLMPRD